jgi:hypothetical protein
VSSLNPLSLSPCSVPQKPFGTRKTVCGRWLPMEIHHGLGCSEKGVRLAQKMQVGPCIPVGIQL